MSNAIGYRRESNPSRRICNPHAVPLDHVTDKIFCSVSKGGAAERSGVMNEDRIIGVNGEKVENMSHEEV